MEKVIYLLWRSPSLKAEDFSARLRLELAPQLQQAGARGLKLNLADEAVAPAAGLRQVHMEPQPEALVQVWLDSAIARFRQPLDVLVAAHSARHAAYLVTESQPLRNRRRPLEGSRTDGFAQIALLQKPAALDYARWLDIWHNSHTGVAIETQSTFEYIQNVVVRTLTPEAPAFDAIVEECFPAEAMTDPQVFFDAAGDPDKFQRNLQRMMDSVHRFIDMQHIEVFPTSQYPMF